MAISLQKGRWSVLGSFWSLHIEWCYFRCFAKFGAPQNLAHLKIITTLLDKDDE